ncbi:hypothetical protein [Nocardia caishijiensis]|uniref:Uncharacterized protein n=1 Tax=Nocardia caishijiensis TaxID=184756 RepID=A0ABQ6YL80_9NOCA|nr:hypothetical protein [Nocardia caishijiensis]KAF0846196.1 hypothetical protein FNL39_105107 [Nocardia caishijiensis]
MSGRNGFLLLGGISSVGAGAVHFLAAGMHTEHATLARLMVVLAAMQCAVGLAVLLSERKIIVTALAAVNAFAVAVWAFTRFADIGWVAGLTAEAPGVADTVCAALGALAVLGAAVDLLRPGATLPPMRSGIAAAAVGVLALAAMLNGVGHVHSHGDSGDHAHAAGEDHSDTWPRAFDPAAPIDVSGVPGVTAEQEQRATALIRNTLDKLPAFADINAIGALGFRSIGDAATGYEHWINTGYIRDDSFLDPTRPESLVYRVDGQNRTLVSAMYIAKGKKIDDPALTEYAGSLMQWHVHDNLCWKAGDNGPQVAGVTDENGNCPPNSINPGAGNPMVHVWIAAHECGPFAALEGHGAGQAATDGRRTDTCGDGHSHGGHK